MVTYHSGYHDPRDELPRVQANIAWLVADSTLSWEIARHLIDALNRLVEVLDDIDPPRRPDDYRPEYASRTLHNLHDLLVAASFDAADRHFAIRFAWAARDLQAAVRADETEQQRLASPR